MLVSTKGRYALRVMTELACHAKDEFVPLKTIARQQNISEKCSVGTELNVTRNEKGLLLSAGEFPVGTVSGSKQKEYEDNEDIVKKVTVSKITEGANSKLLLTAEVTVGI